MSVFELYFRTDLSLNKLAYKICESLGIANFDQRNGANRGGLYFEMRVFGLTLELLSNRGEVEIPERRDWQYYMLVYSDEIQMNDTSLRVLCDHAADIMNRQAIETEVDSLS